MRKIVATGAAVAVAGGMVIAGATGAQAKMNNVSAPSSVTAGETFIVNCKVKQKWAGATVTVLEKGATVNAQRIVDATGNCSLHLVLNATGNKKIRLVVTATAGNSIQSKWLPITVNAA